MIIMTNDYHFRCEACDSTFPGAEAQWMEVELLEHRVGDSDSVALMREQGMWPRVLCPTCLANNEE